MQCEPIDAKATIAARTWSPGSWRACEALQMAEYDDKAQYAKVMDKLSKVPPLVHAVEVDRLQADLAAAARGEKFIIQGGDCAERFIDCEGDRLEKNLKLIVQMGALVEAATGLPPVRVSRIAGQYGKPRSSPTEKHPTMGEINSFKVGRTHVQRAAPPACACYLPSQMCATLSRCAIPTAAPQGDNINGYAATDRAWDPNRLLEGYWHSCATLNFLRSQAANEDFGSAMLGPLDVDFLRSSPSHGSWLKAAQSAKARAAETQRSLYTAHEAMQLDLEEALTREVPGKGFYNLSAHMVWIGDRTRQLLGAHVEYFRGIKNPIGCKVGPSMAPEELKELVGILNPDRLPGHLVLITRYGNAKIESMLPAHIKAVAESGVPVVWQCDGVHGNTVTAAANKLKTRKLDDVVGECTKAIRIHRENGSNLGGIHIEMTGQETVTECTGGCTNIFEEMLTNNYETYCDPRLNYAQAIEAALLCANTLSSR
jgi:3-deoxy-7-phosphoheptulonate synthase